MSKRIKKCVYYDYMLCKTFLHTLVFEDASSPLFLTYCRIDIFRVLRQSFCGKFQIVCGFWNPANPVFRMYADNLLIALASALLKKAYSKILILMVLKENSKLVYWTEMMTDICCYHKVKAYLEVSCIS